ncbi:hypothetical protein [Hyphomicrobium sp.]|jgi:hypothetical protein|uniref:hypothetical protein n=1 Tax=Hyphomicrobium sp. TaxID=82 RepID=UPI002FE00715
MTTYYDYLRDRIAAASVRDAAQLDQLIHLERNALWQQLLANPVYDERGRMAALAAFDEAASYILSEQNARFGRHPARPAVLEPDPAAHRAPAREPAPARSLVRDALVFLAGVAVGIALAYVAGSVFTQARSGSEANLDVRSFEPSAKSFKFVKSAPSPLEGAITVTYAPGTPSDTFACEVEASYRQLLEYVRFDDACKTVAFKFLPLPELWQSFNYLQGYMVFSATITAPGGGKWQGSASVYFSIDATT